MRPSHNFVRGERIESVEVFVRLRVNLQLLKGKSAGKRAYLRARFIDFLDRLSALTCTFGSCQSSYVPQ